MAMRMRFRMRPPNPAIWAGEPSEREIEIERKLDAIKTKHKGRTADELPEAVLREYGRLSCDLIEESQRRSGLTLIKITRNADDSSATYDLRNLRRMMRGAAILMDAGMSEVDAVAHALENERFRQQREADAKEHRGGE